MLWLPPGLPGVLKAAYRCPIKAFGHDRVDVIAVHVK